MISWTISAMILVLAAALLLSYLQATCERILRREFKDPLPDPIVDANRLEFPYVRQTLEEFDAPLDYPRFSMHLKCDYLALIYLLKNAANQKRRLSRSERALAIYFWVLSGTLAVLHLMKFGERAVLLKMTAVLEYFANVLGDRIKRLPFGRETASEYLMSL
jgi:hypothetical protein